MLIHIFLMWVLSPGVGAGVAIYASASAFKTVPVSHIFVSFVSVCAAILALVFLFGIVAYAHGGSSTGELIMFILQAVAIFVGARIGRGVAAANQLRP